MTKILFYIHGQSREDDDFVQYIRGYNKRQKVGTALQERPERCYEISTEGDRQAGIQSLPCPLSGGVGRTAPEEAAFQWILEDGCALPPRRQEGGLPQRGTVVKLRRAQASPVLPVFVLFSARFIAAATSSPSPSALRTLISSPLHCSPRLSRDALTDPLTPSGAGLVLPPVAVRTSSCSSSCCVTSCCVTSCLESPLWTPGSGGWGPCVPPGAGGPLFDSSLSLQRGSPDALLGAESPLY